MDNYILVGYGRWGKVVARNFPYNMGLLHIFDGDIPQINSDSLIFYNKHITREHINKINPKAIYVATPNKTHADILKEISPSCKVLFEKPSFYNINEYELLYDSGCKLNHVYCGHIMLQCNGLKLLKKHINSIKPKEIFISAFRHNQIGPIGLDIQCILDLGIHEVSVFVDLLYLLYGKIPSRNIIDINDVLYTQSSNRFAANFNLSYNNLHMEVDCNWMGVKRLREYKITLINRNDDKIEFIWDLDKDIFTPINYSTNQYLDNFTTERRNNGTNLNKQWTQLSLDVPDNLHDFDDGYYCRKIIDCYKGD